MSLIVRKNANGLTRSFGSLMSDFFENSNFFEGEFFNDTSIPAVNVKETDENFELEIAAPGMKRGDFKVGVDNGILSIKAEREENKEEENERYTRKEFNYSSFSRSFTLPDSVNNEDIHAKYNEGILKLTLTKNPETNIKPLREIIIE